MAVLAAGAALVVPSWAPRATADERDECLTAYEDTQLLRRQGDARGARTAARRCARATCVETLRQECLEWLPEIERTIPTVILRARRDGQDLTSVTVRVDGKVVVTALDGRSLELDPGPHRFQFVAPGLPPGELTLVIAVGEKNRIIQHDFEGPPRPSSDRPTTASPADPTSSSRGGTLPILAAASAGLGAAGLGLGIAFGVDALNKRDRAAEVCSGDVCREPRGLEWTDQAKTSADVSTVAFVVGAIGLATGFTLWALSPSPAPAGPPHPSPSSRWFTPEALAISIQLNGASACGRF